MNNNILIYTDGSCYGNPGPGGWAAIIIDKNKKYSISGHREYSTNNEMELEAVYKALSHFKEKKIITIKSDSAYVVGCFKNQWYKRWIQNDWKNSKNQPVKNKEMWQKILILTGFHKVKFEKVKAHSRDSLNNECDLIAKSAVKK
jgi:ribonuclease HI